MRMLGCKSKKALDMFLQENEAAKNYIKNMPGAKIIKISF